MTNSIIKHSGKFKPYPKYKPSGIEWLGDIPQGWIKNKIKNVTDFQVGWTPSTSEDKYFIGSNSWANISDLKSKTIFETEKCLSDEAVKSNRIKVTPKGSLLFSFKLSVGTVSFAGIDLYTNEAIASFLASSKINLKFLYYASPLFILQNASNNIYGAKILNQELIKNAVIVPPPLDEQTQIAEFLDIECGKIDKLIEKSEKMLGLLDEKRQAVITHYVTKGINPNAPLKSSGIDWIGDIPQDWSFCLLKYKISKITDGSHMSPELDNGIYPFVSTVDINNGNIDFENCLKTSLQNYNLLKTQDCQPKIGDVLFSKDGTIGKTAIVNYSDNFVVASSLIIISPEKNKTNSKFIEYLFQSSLVMEQINSFVKGVALKRLSLFNLKKIYALFPPISEQIEIAEYIDKQTAKIDLLKTKIVKQIELLKERKTSLITSAVTGKIDVRDYKNKWRLHNG